MDVKTLSIVLSMSIAVPSLLAMGRFSNIQKKYYPFVFCLWLGFLVELLVASFFQHIPKEAWYTTHTIYNIYVLFEFPLYCWLFYNFSPGRTNRLVLFLLAGLGLVIWMVESFELRTIRQISSYYRIYYSFVLVLLSINHTNRLLLNERTLILYNASFLICAGIIVYYSFKILVEVFWEYAPKEAATQIFDKIIPYLNTLLNLIFALAVLCIPKRISFSKT